MSHSRHAHWPLMFSLVSCTIRPPEAAHHERISVDRFAHQTTFAIIGDFGLAGPAAADVAAMVRSWNPDFILTTGDNNYPDGAADTIDANVGQYYHEFIAPYGGGYGPGAPTNRFFPALGNHDWHTPDLAPYLSYFALPGNERYYSLSWGPVDIFVVDSDRHEPDGIDANSVQAQWLHKALNDADGPWKLVIMHHPPFSSADHGSNPVLQWPYADWGATAIIAGHDHVYERIEQAGLLFFVNGLGGNPERYTFQDSVSGSTHRYNADYGAMQVHADQNRIVFEFRTRDGSVIDRVERHRP